MLYLMIVMRKGLSFWKVSVTIENIGTLTNGVRYESDVGMGKL